MSHILNHNRTIFDVKLDRSESWDFFLAQDRLGGSSLIDGSLTERCLSAYIDTNDESCITDEGLCSTGTYFWDEAVNNGLSLYNIGYTGVDNGLIKFDKYTISNEEFTKLFTSSDYNIAEGNMRLILNRIDGNNDIFACGNRFTYENDTKIAELNGGFFQGFFKSGCDYHILPSNVGSGLSFEFTFKKTDEVSDNSYTLNDRYPENKGTFFYFGTRAENKWWKNYDPTTAFEDIFNDYFADDYFSDGYLGSCETTNYFVESEPISYNNDGYISDGYSDEDDCYGNCSGSSYYNGKETNDYNVIITYPEIINTYWHNTVWATTNGGVWIENEDWTMNYKKPGCHKRKGDFCGCKDYFADNYMKKRYDECNCDIYSNDDYSKPDSALPSIKDLTTSDGHSLTQANVYEFKTDNKFILFDRTCDGFTADTWVEGSEAIVTDIRMPKDENYFITFHRGCGGLTADRFKHVNQKYNVLSDLYRNAFALQVKDDGSIGYKYLIQDCDSEEQAYAINSGFSKPNIIPDNEWVTVHVVLKPIGIVYGKETVATSFSQKMVLYIYVNGKLVYVSDEIPTLNLKELNDLADKQEGVPFNISVGGGTQGLSDVIYDDFKKLPDKRLPLEKEFGGSFIGYFKSFKAYSCALSLSEIRNNVIFENAFRLNNTIY